MTNYLLKVALGAVILITPVSVGAAETTMCTMQYQPVCGAQQVQCFAAPCYPMYHTYGNSCVLGVEKGTFIHEGECTALETGPIKPAQPYVPPANCTAWFDGCNRCSKSAGGQAMCTLMACMDEPKAGYCTAYAHEKPKPVVTPPPQPEVIDSGPLPEASTPPTDQATPDNWNFFQQLWSAFLHWLGF